MKIKSMPQFFDKRFVSSPMKLFATFVIFIFLLPYSASVYKGLTSVCAVLLKVDERICMVVIALAAMAVVVLGGYAATLKADFVQGIIMLVGVTALIVAVVQLRNGGRPAGRPRRHLRQNRGAEPGPEGAPWLVGHRADDLLRHLGPAPDDP